MRSICTKAVICFALIFVTLIILGTVLLSYLFINKSNYYEFNSLQSQKRGAAVVANGIECANIGEKILRLNGSAVDAAIATLFCEGVAVPQSMGLGGGFFMTIYTKATNNVETLNAREVAPLAATEKMFVNKTNASKKGGLSIAVFGELKGYYEAHQKYGKLPWPVLVEPTIQLCKNGHIVSSYLANILAKRRDELLNEPSLKEIFINPVTNEPYKQGERIKRLKLAESLEIISKEGSDALHSPNGSLLKKIVADIKSFNGIITEEDFLQYKVEWDKPDISQLEGGYTMYTHPLPGSGSILTFILNVLSGYQMGTDYVSMHRMIESFKYGYAKRTNLGDKKFVPGLEELLTNLTSPYYANYIRSQISDTQTYNDYEHYGANFTNVEDHGTAHVSVLHQNGDAVSVTSTINLILGAAIRSMSTGIIFNDEMDDFSTPGLINEFGIPASPANYIRPKKHPLSSMVPTIIVDKNGDPKLIIGAAGGSKITTSVAYVILQHLWFNKTLEDSVSTKRIHHQLAPMRIQHEIDYDPAILKELTKLQHELEPISTESGFAAVMAISKERSGKINAVYDPRRGGSIAIIE